MWVTLSSPQGTPQSVHVDGGSLVFGRAGTCDVVIDDPHVSMRHAQLDIADGGVWLADLRSTNGTFVHSQRLTAPVRVAVPSEFRVGGTTVSLAADEPSTRSWPPAATYAANAGPVAGGNVSISAGRDAAGRDLIIHEGFKLRTKMRSSAKNCIRLGCVLFLVGFGLFGYFVITWNNEIFSAVSNASQEPPSDLPSPLPWLPLGALLIFAGIVLVVTGLLIPRDQIVTRRDG
jgi:hypothetical protein